MRNLLYGFWERILKEWRQVCNSELPVWLWLTLTCHRSQLLTLPTQRRWKRPIFLDLSFESPSGWAPLLAPTVKTLPAMQETQVQSLGGEDPLEREMATHSSILAWIIPRTEEPGRLQSTGLQRVRDDWVTKIFTSLSMYPGITTPYQIFPWSFW